MDFIHLGCVYTDTSTSPATRVWVTVNTSLHVFQQQPFAVIQVLHTSTNYLEIQAVFVYSSSFWIGLDCAVFYVPTNTV